MRIGFKLSSEERPAAALVREARVAEEAGFDFVAISDHFHPWIDAQGESPFVWAVIGGIAEATDRITVGTAVTCPTIRTHPAIVAHAAATVATMLPDRFFLGVGTGENLNEHVLGDRWPGASQRRELLEEAVEVIRELWAGELVNHRGRHYEVEGARLYSLPEEASPIYVAGSGPAAAELAGRIGDGFIGLAPDAELLATFADAGGGSKPRLAEITVRYDDDAGRALKHVAEVWPIPGIPGELTAELPLPRHFEQAAEVVGPEDLQGKVVVGPDPEPYLEMAGRYAEAGYDHVWFHHVGEDKERFLTFAAQELVSRVRELGSGG